MKNCLKGNAFEQPDIGPTCITRMHGKYTVRKQSPGTAEQCLLLCSDLFLLLLRLAPERGKTANTEMRTMSVCTKVRFQNFVRYFVYM